MKNNTVTTHKSTTKSILDLQNLFKLRHLNLEPGFQRQSVWTERDRAKLVESILRNYPLPAIFLYKREVKGHLVFDVIDATHCTHEHENRLQLELTLSILDAI